MTYLQPLYCLFLGLLGVLWWLGIKGRRWAKAAFPIAILLMALVAWPPFGWALSWTLESHYPQRVPSAEGVRAIVVLSGGTYSPEPATPYFIPAGGSYRRTWHGRFLHGRSDLPVVVSGGKLGGGGSQTHAGVMRKVLLATGLKPADVIAEERSRNTYENAVFSAEILKQRGWQRVLLVTEAYHMPRAAACFRKQGIEVVPAPCFFRSTAAPQAPTDWVPGPEGLHLTEDAMREWFALAVYKLIGRI